VEIRCFVHARRKFFGSRSSDPVRARRVMARIRLTHAVKAASQGLDKAGRLTLRERSALLIERPGPRLDEQTRVVPMKSPIDYARSNCAALNRLTESVSGSRFDCNGRRPAGDRHRRDGRADRFEDG